MNVPLENDYKNTLYFGSRGAQQTYFQSRIIKSYSDFSYQRKDSIIRVPDHFDELHNVNYVMYQNTAYSNKWFYAFITDMKYVDDGRTDIQIETDVLQTWLLDFTVKPSFVEREHVSDDTVGIHTLDENLEIGDLISDWGENSTDIGSDNGWYWFTIACNYDPSNQTRTAGVGVYGDYPQGSQWFAWLINPNNFATEINEISQWVYDLTRDGHANDIQTMFALPFQAFSVSDVDATTHKVTSGAGTKVDVNKVYNKSVARTFSDYQPKNNKLFVYPYSFMRITNNMGSYNDYKIEDFHEMNAAGTEETDNMTFNLIGTPCQGYAGKIRPKYYRGTTYNEDESLQMGKYPSLSWSSDAFTNWLTQNAVNLSVGAVSTIVGGLVGAGSGNALAVGNSISSIAGQIGQLRQASMMPNTAQGNANAGDISFLFNINRFKFLHMRPKKEYLEIIDDFFSMFGYKVNRVKIPNSNHRSRWWYIKTNEVNIDGAIPNKDMQIIKDSYNKGITFWRNASEIQNYNLSNDII